VLPRDEYDLVATWPGSSIRLLRVQRSLGSAAFIVVDIDTGEEIEVRHHGFGPPLEPGRVVTAALVPDGDGLCIVGPAAIDTAAVDDLLREFRTRGLPAVVQLVVTERWKHFEAVMGRVVASTDARLAWLFPDTPVGDRKDSTIAELVETDHPEMVEAIEQGRQQVRIEGGHDISPGLHLAIHEIAVEQIIHDEPPEMWLTALRLEQLGYERHEILHMLGSAVSAQVYGALNQGSVADSAEQLEDLAALPATWEANRYIHEPSTRPRRAPRGRHRR
jgi:hypothetical protein